jgi:HSP20 family protein
MEYAVDRLWRGFGPRAGVPTSDADTWGIPLDVVRDTDSVVVRASLAGVKPGDINVTIEDNLLTVTGSTETETERGEGDNGTYLLRERRTGSFRRSIRLPDYVDTDKAESAYEAGVLTITLPKIEARKAKQLTVQVKDSTGKELAEAA